MFTVLFVLFSSGLFVGFFVFLCVCAFHFFLNFFYRCFSLDRERSRHSSNPTSWFVTYLSNPKCSFMFTCIYAFNLSYLKKKKLKLLFTSSIFLNPQPLWRCFGFGPPLMAKSYKFCLHVDWSISVHLAL